MRMLRQVVGLDEAKRRAELCAKQGGLLVYAASTCWWYISIDPRKPLPYLCPNGITPCDPRGSVLFETDDPVGFIAAAEAEPDHYGKHGLDALMAAFHGNLVTDDGRPTSLVSWDEYNAVLDKAEAGQ